MEPHPVFAINTPFRMMGLDITELFPVIFISFLMLNLFKAVMNGVLAVVCTALFFFVVCWAFKTLRSQVQSNFYTHLPFWLLQPGRFHVAKDIHHIPVTLERKPR